MKQIILRTRHHEESVAKYSMKVKLNGITLKLRVVFKWMQIRTEIRGQTDLFNSTNPHRMDVLEFCGIKSLIHTHYKYIKSVCVRVCVCVCVCVHVRSEAQDVLQHDQLFTALIQMAAYKKTSFKNMGCPLSTKVTFHWTKNRTNEAVGKKINTWPTASTSLRLGIHSRLVL